MVVGVLNPNRSAPAVTWRCTRCEVVRLLRRDTPVMCCCTRYVAMHPLRRDAPEQKGCTAYGSGVAPSSTRNVAVVCQMTMLGSLLNAAASA